MLNYKDLSLKELFELCEKQIKAVVKNVKQDFYPDMVDEEHLKIKVYQAIDRTKMYIATEITSDTFYSFDLYSYFENRNRKMLIKIAEGTKNLTYLDVRNMWHNIHKELFYQQKESLKIQEKLNRICVVARLTKGAYQKEGFVRIFNGELSIVQSISDATEFIAVSDEIAALFDIEDLLNKRFNLSVSTFFNNKIKGRNVYIRSLMTCTNFDKKRIDLND